MPTGSISRCGGATPATTLAEAIVGDASLWAFYRLSEPSGTIAGDSGPFGLHLSTAGFTAPAWNQSPAPPGEPSAYFSLADAARRTADFATLVAGDFTAEAWLNDVSSSLIVVVGQGNPIGSVNGWSLTSISGSRAVLWVGNNVAVEQIVADTYFTVGAWYHLATTRTSGTWRMYINGVQQSGTTAFVPNSGGDDGLTIGSIYNNPTLSSDALLAYVAVYDRAFTAAEVLAHYHLAVP